MPISVGSRFILLIMLFIGNKSSFGPYYQQKSQTKLHHATETNPFSTHYIELLQR